MQGDVKNDTEIEIETKGLTWKETEKLRNRRNELILKSHQSKAIRGTMIYVDEVDPETGEDIKKPYNLGMTSPYNRKERRRLKKLGKSQKK